MFNQAKKEGVPHGALFSLIRKEICRVEMEFDFDAFFKSLDWSKTEVLKGAEKGLVDATGDLMKKSVNLAPLYVRKGANDERPSGGLRASVGRDVRVEGKGLVGEVGFNATEETESGERVNYALITHELHSGDGYSGIRFKNPSTPGTQPKYLEQPLMENAETYKKMIADGIREELGL